MKGDSPHDQRGKQTPSNAHSIETRRKVIDHIGSFPCKESHYCSKDRYYVNATLNRKIMHDLYEAKEPNNRVSYWYFCQIFKDYFGKLGFGRPQVDTCCECERLGEHIVFSKAALSNKNETYSETYFACDIFSGVKILDRKASDEERKRAVVNKMVHCKQAKKFFHKMRAIREDAQSSDSIIALSIDYMQNISLPTVPVQQTFYLRQLTVNVFSIHNLKDNSAVFFVYEESEAGKGSNEVCSLLHHYLKTYRSPKPKEECDFVLFSDSCGGQNRNHTVMRFLSCLSGQFKSVRHYLPHRGHSFLPNDRDFSVVKRKLKKHDRFYTTKDVIRIIASSPQVQQRSRFEVTRVTHHDILNFKDAGFGLFKKSVICDEHKAIKQKKFKKLSFQIASFKDFEYTTPGIVKCRPLIDGLVSYSFNLQSMKSLNITKLYFSNLRRAYRRRLPINVKKMEDLRKFEPYLPPKCKSFWNSIYRLKTRYTE